MKNILLWGAGNTAEVLIRHANGAVAEIIDNNADLHGKTHCGVIVKSPEYLREADFDYIVVCVGRYTGVYRQLTSLGVPERKVVLFYEDYIRYQTARYEKLSPPTVWVTGISYAYYIRFRHMSVANLSEGGQDLFFDSLMVRNMLPRLNKPKAVLICAYQYMLEYDLLKSRNSEIAARYGWIIGDTNAFKVDVSERKNAEIQRIFGGLSIEGYTHKENVLEELFGEIQFGFLRRVTDESGFETRSLLHSKKNYPVTVAENKRILEDLIMYLRANGVTPILFTTPQHKRYRAAFSERIYSEFRSFVGYLQEQYAAAYIDAYCDEYANHLYYDGDHLNADGYKIFNDKLEKAVSEILDARE